MAPPSRAALDAQRNREQKLAEGMRKLEEFQRRKQRLQSQPTNVGTEITPDAYSRQQQVSLSQDVSYETLQTQQRPPQQQQQQQQQPQPQQQLLLQHQQTQQSLQQRMSFDQQTNQSAPQMAAVVPAAASVPPGSATSIVTPVTPSSAAGGELGARLQHLIRQLAVVASSGAARDLSQLDELQRHCTQLAHEANETQRERQAQAAQLESLRGVNVQATRTIELLVEEKSRLRSAVDSLEAQLRSRTQEVLMRDAEVRSLRERADVHEGQMAALLQEKEERRYAAQGSQPQGPRDLEGGNASTPSSSEVRLREQIAELEEQQRHSAEKILHLQRANEQSRSAFEAVRNELDVAQAYVRQLAGTTGEADSADSRRNLPENTGRADHQLQLELERLREEIEAERHERSAAELIARNLEASNRGLQQRVTELEATTPGSLHSGGQTPKLNAEVQTTSDGSDIAAGSSDVEIATLRMRSEQQQQELLQLQAELSQLQQKMCDERQSWEEKTASLNSQMATTADELQRAKLDSSRAVAQNRELKKQLEELQDVFVKLSNDKLDLTESMQRERHRAQQLEAQLRQAEEALRTERASLNEVSRRLSETAGAAAASADQGEVAQSALANVHISGKPSAAEDDDQFGHHSQDRTRLLDDLADQYTMFERHEHQQDLESGVRHSKGRLTQLELARLQQQQQQQHHQQPHHHHQHQQLKSAALKSIDDERRTGTPVPTGDSPGGSSSLSEYEFVDNPTSQMHLPGQHFPGAPVHSNINQRHNNNNNNNNSFISSHSSNNNNNNNEANYSNTSVNSNRRDPMMDLAEAARDETGGALAGPRDVTGDFPSESTVDAISVSDNASTTSSRSERGHPGIDQASKGSAEISASILELHERRLLEAGAKISRLQEEKSQLEHQVEQLRMETDTISDYIQLYQQQRAALNQRQREKEAHISQLLADREELSSKVTQLQSLIGKILPVNSSSAGSVSTTASMAGQTTDLSPASGVAGAVSMTPSISPVPSEVITNKILKTLEDLTEASATPPVGIDTFIRCSSCQGCHGRLLSL